MAIKETANIKTGIFKDVAQKKKTLLSFRKFSLLIYFYFPDCLFLK